MKLERLTIVYGLRAGQQERWTEEILSTQCTTPADVEKIKAAATRDGWHSFRVTKADDSPPDFLVALRRPPS